MSGNESYRAGVSRETENSQASEEGIQENTQHVHIALRQMWSIIG